MSWSNLSTASLAERAGRGASVASERRLRLLRRSRKMRKTRMRESQLAGGDRSRVEVSGLCRIERSKLFRLSGQTQSVVRYNECNLFAEACLEAER